MVGSPASALFSVCVTRSERKAMRQLMSPAIVSVQAQPEVARQLGWEEYGILKGSFAARLMSKETKASGCLRCMDLGGITASLQSIGTVGYVKDSASENLQDFQAKAREAAQLLREQAQLRLQGYRSTIQIALPPYFTPSLNSVQLVEYRADGFNVSKAEQMLNESMHPSCVSASTGCQMDGLHFDVVRMVRLENRVLFNKYKHCESNTATQTPLLCPNTNPAGHPWLVSLARKNGLSLAANTHYLLHGTKVENLHSISTEGLCVSRANGLGLYGKGLYFTDSSCKANQYSGAPGTARHGTQKCILICRVVLGNVFKLDRDCRGRMHSPRGYHSMMASGNHTVRPDGAFNRQLHSELVVFEDSAVYPEFALVYNIA